MTPKQISAFERYVREDAERILNTLQQYRLLNPISRELDETAVGQLFAQPSAERSREIQYLIDVAAILGAGYEYLGEINKANLFYRIGMNNWPHPWPQYSNDKGDDSFGLRSTLGGVQLLAAICADRVGEKKRASTLYEWAAQHRTLKPEELDYLAQTEQYQVVWERLPDRAYALACLERWEEALSTAEEAARWVERDKRALLVESYRSAELKLLPVGLALARYKAEPTEPNRMKAQEVLTPQTVATRNHSSHLTALFYLYNLRARHPELVQPPQIVAWPGETRQLELRRELKHPASVSSMVISPDGSLLAVGLGAGQIWLWQVADWTVRLHWDAHPNAVRSLVFSPDGRRLATGANRAYASSEPTLRLWQIDNAAMLYDLDGHTHSVTGVDFAPDGTALASASDDGTVRLWGVNDGLERKKWDVHNEHEILLNAVAFSPDGRWLAAGEGNFHGQVWLWDVERGEVKQVLEEHKEEDCTAPEFEGEIAEHGVWCLAFTPDSELLAAGMFDGDVQIWRVGDGKLVRRLEGHDYDLVESIAVASDGSTVVSAGGKRVQGWQLEDGAPVWMEELSESVHGVAFSPGGRWLAVGTEDGMVRIWSAV